MTYRHVLVAVDLTEEAPEVIAKAGEITAQQGAKLSAVTVVKPMTYSYGALAATSMAEMSLQFEREACKHAEAELAKLCADLPVQVEDLHVLLGRPAVEIKAIAEKADADLIVLGTHGKHGLGLLLGSTANGVVHGTSCDVLAIRVGRTESSA